MKVILIYKDFHAFNPNISHIGLGVAAMNTREVLKKNGVACEDWPVKDSNEIRQRLREYISANTKPDITNVVISAPWILTVHMRTLCNTFPNIQFTMNCHSNVAFLQADPNGTKLLREAIELSRELHNFSVSANSFKMVRWIEAAYKTDVYFLPNLYNLPEKIPPPKRIGNIIRVGIFGAIRPQKNIVSAVGASIVLANQLHKNVEIYLSTGRSEGGGLTIINTVRAMVSGLPNVELVEAGWRSWPEFRALVGHMNLLLTPSYTESFNMVTADGIAEGVSSVVGPAITWAPRSWKADTDDVMEIAAKAERILGAIMRWDSTELFDEGLLHLKDFISIGVNSWRDFLWILDCE